MHVHNILSLSSNNNILSGVSETSCLTLWGRLYQRLCPVCSPGKHSCLWLADPWQYWPLIGWQGPGASHGQEWGRGALLLHEHRDRGRVQGGQRQDILLREKVLLCQLILKRQSLFILLFLKCYLLFFNMPNIWSNRELNVFVEYRLTTLSILFLVELKAQYNLWLGNNVRISLKGSKETNI